MGHISRPLAPARPKSVLTSSQRHASGNAAPITQANREEEGRHAQEKLEQHPDAVSKTSSVTPVLAGQEGGGGQDQDTDMLAGIKGDMRAIGDTFALTDVPRDAYYIGLAGVLPYLATSLSTYFLAWDIDHAHHWGEGFLFSGQTAELMLHVIEPIQIGYGAVILSFLGAINWGMEFAGYGGRQTSQRYAVGVIAPAVAWPTMFLPVEYALTTQFLAFTMLYFIDAQSTKNGWFPSWYGTYRFVLTFIVGASIVVSLIGRGKIADKVGKLPGPADRLKALRDSQWEHMEKEEEERQARLNAADEEEDEEEIDVYFFANPHLFTQPETGSFSLML
ncbi:MAG: hypothetical protein M1816_006970 [Peltula sp. TS41687]|nr:MAG: hypothetical protein M1816_006970 [Peltula sp. TS41687]